MTDGKTELDGATFVNEGTSSIDLIHRTRVASQTGPLLMFRMANSDGVSVIGTALELLDATMNLARA